MRRVLLLGLPLAFLAAGCTYDNGDAQRVLAGNSCGPAQQSAIDTDSQIEVDAGQGAGVFLEYATGGHWQLRTSCDTLKNSGVTCAWDIIVTPEDGQSLSNVAPTDLESTDSLLPYPDSSRSYQMIAETAGDIDGFTFDSAPGAAVSVDAFLDGNCALPFFFWSGGGALHQGSPSNPLILVPSAQ